MPEGVEVAVDGDSATIDFIDPARRGPGLACLLEHAPAEVVETLTRGGPRTRYRVPARFARAAGFLDRASRVDALQAPDTSSAADATGSTPPEAPSTRDLFAQTIRAGKYARLSHGDKRSPELARLAGQGNRGPEHASQSYDDGLPDMDWSRKAINDYAAAITPPLNTTGEPNKRAAIAAVNAAITGGAKRPE